MPAGKNLETLSTSLADLAVGELGASCAAPLRLAMPTTRAPGAAARAARCLTEVLPADALGLVLYQLTLAHDIAAVAPTCHVLCDAAKLDDKTVKLFNVDDGAVLRTFKHHGDVVSTLALLPDGLRFVSGSYDKTVRIAYHGLSP